MNLAVFSDPQDPIHSSMTATCPLRSLHLLWPAGLPVTDTFLCPWLVTLEPQTKHREPRFSAWAASTWELPGIPVSGPRP